MNDILTNLINDKHLDKYLSFKGFCLYKKQGLRKKAFKSLNSFIEETKKWNGNKKKEFVCWLFGLLEKSEDVYIVLVYPLVENLLKPTLNEWIISDSKDARPFKWFGIFLNVENRMEYLEKAFEIGGKKEQRVLTEMIDICLHSISYSFHHISEDLYLGDIEEDREILFKIKRLSAKSEDAYIKEKIEEAALYYENLLNDWIDFKSQDKEGFTKWCADKGKQYEWINSYYY